MTATVVRSRLVLGTAPLAGLFRPVSAEAARATIDRAWELGVRHFDTAPLYGSGIAEERLGAALAARPREEYTISTKVGRVLVAGTPSPQFIGAPPLEAVFDYTPDGIRRSLAGSLERLGLERVDLYLIHEPDPETPVERTLEAMTELVEHGTVSAVGASNVDGPYLEDALAISERRGLARFEWVQNSYSLLERDAERDVLPLCREHGLGFTPFSPLAGGWLTGKYRRGEPLPAGSRMATRPGPYLHLDDDRVYDGLDRLGEEAARRGASMSGLALAWLLAQPQVDGIVVGPRRPEHLEPAREALLLELDPEEATTIAEVFG
jgi:aryl-alcohol dehydrogenase-like predicted oxidoreductase